MAKDDGYFSKGQPCKDSQMHALQSLQGEAKREGQLGKSVEANDTNIDKGYEGTDAD